MMKIGRIVKIINEYKVVINLGKYDRVKKGDVFLIYEIGEEIFDPETNKSLGKLEIVKGQGKAVHVQENITTIETIETKKIREIKKPLKTFSQFIGQEVEVYDYEPIPFENVKINDFVKKIR